MEMGGMKGKLSISALLSLVSWGFYVLNDSLIETCQWAIMNVLRKWKWKSLSHVWLFLTPWLLCPWNSPGKNTGVVLVIPFSRGSSRPRNRTQVSHIAGGFFTNWATREALSYIRQIPFSAMGERHCHWHYVPMTCQGCSGLEHISVIAQVLRTLYTHVDMHNYSQYEIFCWNMSDKISPWKISPCKRTR